MKILKNYINASWEKSSASQLLDVVDPGTQKVLSQVPLGNKEDVDSAARSASKALPGWRNIPATQRIQYLFKLKKLLEDNTEEVARMCSMESGKTLGESRAEMQRAVENVEVACGIPMLLQSEFSEDIAVGIDEFVIRQPVGVAACIAPFNFPIMIPFWFLPYAIACGNTYIIKPSEKVPETMKLLFELIDQLELPDGVVNLVNGGKEVVDAILDHREIKAISFVGSTKVAKYIYERAAATGKRVQAQGGAKNPVIILPDSDMEVTTRIINDSVYGCAGQRCLAASTIMLVDDASKVFTEALVDAASKRTTGYGLDESVEMGALISPESKGRTEKLIQQGIDEGAQLLLDGRNTNITGYEKGNYVKPTILENVNPKGDLNKTEIFGPVMGIIHVDTIDQAIQMVNENNYGNAACIFTSNGAHARKFRNEANAGNIGINIGIAAPMAFFPFSGWNDSFFGDLHGQGKHAVEFFTQTKVVIERWPKEWTRKF